MNNSNYSGRTARTWSEARGPYASCEISEPPIMSKGDMAVIATCLLGLLVLIVLGVM